VLPWTKAVGRGRREKGEDEGIEEVILHSVDHNEFPFF
jgi:hypothetical protein